MSKIHTDLFTEAEVDANGWQVQITNGLARMALTNGNMPTSVKACMDLNRECAISLVCCLIENLHLTKYEVKQELLERAKDAFEDEDTIPTHIETFSNV